MAPAFLCVCPNCMTVFDTEPPPFNPTLLPRDILDSNDYPPQETQIPLVSDFISKGRARMTLLNAKVTLLLSTLDEFLEESSLLEAEIQKHESSLSNLRRIPTEILSLIFIFSLPPHQINTDPAPWTISQVCVRWRTIVISQPFFWASVNLTLHQNFADSFRLETQLHRSGELPLNIEFSTHDTCLHCDFTEPQCIFSSTDFRIIQILCKHASRWETLTISGPLELYVQLRNIVPDQFPLLRELTVEMIHKDDGGAPLLDIFADAPLLQSVVVNKSLSWRFNLETILPWSQLLKYGGSDTWLGHLHTLSSASNLVECCLQITQTALPQTPILLPRLLRLSLSNPEFLECLDTPALLELYCDYSNSVLSFLLRQPCELQKLVMWDWSAPADATDLTRMVQAVPTLTDLALLFPLPAEFALDFSRPDIGPALEHISSVLIDALEVQNHFMQAIESRWQGGRLKSVKVHSPDFASSIEHRMEVLQVQGLEFRRVYYLLQEVVPAELIIES
ncbi:hypothetical protein B0H19DRAFT_1117351 [Mycena capillaripes]|nr:hypothetical protein B0H19DRAFT_1117351 [Mycena capillaripes]